jgi:hypothetical protein
MKKFVKYLALSALFFSIFSAPAKVLAQGPGSNNVLLETETFAIQITSDLNVPQFAFWDPTVEPITKYHVKFTRLFESVDLDADNTYTKESETIVVGSNEALAPLTWEFTELVTVGSMTHFNITSVGEDYTLQFRNHFNADDMSLKFDIVIDNYTFVSEDEDAMLVFGFHIVEGQQKMNQNQHKVQFGNKGYFESASEANTANETIPVGMSSAKDGQDAMIYISFPKFEGLLVHDPIIGLESSGVSVAGFSNLWLAIFPALGILYVIIKKRMK